MRPLSKSFYEANIILTPKLDKDITNIEHHIPIIPLINKGSKS